jgi:hypothetical protein
MNTFNRRLLVAGSMLYSLLLSGCSGGVKIVPVEGTVTLESKPLDKIMVEFWPESDGPRSFAETDAQGHFKLTTDDGKRVGASVGKHRVILKDAAVLGDKFMGRAGENVDMSQGRKSRINRSFGQTETTTLKVEVVSSGKNEFPLEATK